MAYHFTLRGERVQRDTLADLASEYAVMRDASFEGASTFPTPAVYRGRKRIGTFSYNGRVWDAAGNAVDFPKKALTLPGREQLARAFSAELTAQLGAKVVAKINRLNTPEERAADICHSHDFCDANMVMLAAFARCVGTSENEITDRVTSGEDAVVDLWNAAWSLATDNKFYTEN